MMFSTILTPDEAKHARAAVRLSQNKVAQATGISRTHLALFEVKKYLLDDDTLTKLKQFYREEGYDFTDNSSVEQPVSISKQVPDVQESTGLRLMDGYAIPEGISEEEAELILSKISENNIEIVELASKKSDVNWWSEKPKTERLNRLLILHARNYLLTQRLQGHELLNNTTCTENTPPEDITNSMLFSDVISE